MQWIRRRPRPWLSWVLHGGYLAYYPIIVGAPLGLQASGRREGMQRALTAIMATFYLCYLTFLLFPVVGPRHAFPPADNSATRTAIARLTGRFLHRVAAWGAAFPSSHVAVSATATAAAFREWRGLGFALTAPTTLLALGAVYGQFHYAVDVLAGLAVAAVVTIGSRWRRRRGTRAGPPPDGRPAAAVPASSVPVGLDGQTGAGEAVLPSVDDAGPGIAERGPARRRPEGGP